MTLREKSKARRKKGESFSTPTPVVLARTAPHPNAAKLYTDFILSKEAQEIITKEFIGISDRPDVKRVFTREGLKLHYADLNLAERYDEITKKFDTVFKIR